MTWSPLACGFLTGKYDDGVPIYSRAALKVSQVSLKVTQYTCNMNRLHGRWKVKVAPTPTIFTSYTYYTLHVIQLLLYVYSVKHPFSYTFVQAKLLLLHSFSKIWLIFCMVIQNQFFGHCLEWLNYSYLVFACSMVFYACYWIFVYFIFSGQFSRHRNRLLVLNWFSIGLYCCLWLQTVAPWFSLTVKMLRII